MFDLYEAAKEVALGRIRVLKTSPEGQEYIYDVPPDPKMLIYLMDRGLGRVPMAPKAEMGEIKTEESFSEMLDRAIEKRKESKTLPERVVEGIKVEKKEEKLDRDAIAARVLGL